jgi:AraC-like DNA-binding protein
MTLLASLCGIDSEDTHVSELVRQAMPLLSAGHGVQEVVKRLRVSYPTLYRQFKEGTGISPKDYASQIRSARAEEFLAASTLSVKEIAARLNYNNASHFSLDFKRTHGVAPSDWKVRQFLNPQNV